jgi:hypothetical protein
MNHRAVVTIFASAALTAGCAPRARVTSDNETHNRPVGTHAATAAGLAVTLTQISDAGQSGKAGENVQFALHVTNPGKRMELRFPNGKTHDFVVLDSKDREVWRWSAGRLFTQTLQTRQLKTGDDVRYEATWTGATPGTYRVVALLNSETLPEQIEQELIIPGPKSDN